MSRRTLLYVALAVVGLAAAVALSTVATVEQARPDGPCADARWGCAEFEPEEPVIVGVMLPTTGPFAERGRADLARIEEAVARVRTKVWRHPIRLVHRDDACSFEAASEAARFFGTSESPTRPPTALVIGGICREAALPAAQILSDAGVPFLSWFPGELEFADPAPRLSFYVRTPAGHDGASTAAEIAIDAVRQVAIRGPDGTIYVPRIATRDALRQEVRERFGSVAAP